MLNVLFIFGKWTFGGLLTPKCASEAWNLKRIWMFLQCTAKGLTSFAFSDRTSKYASTGPPMYFNCMN